MEIALHTNHGDIVVGLYPNYAPKAVANFIELATGKRKWTSPATGEKTTGLLYDGTAFHHVIDSFMIQGDDPLGRGTGGPGYQLGDEIHPELNFNDPYVLVIANTGPGTNGPQFSITMAPTAWLYGKRTIFDKVVDNTSKTIIDEIARVSADVCDKPTEDIVTRSVDVAE